MLNSKLNSNIELEQMRNESNNLIEMINGIVYMAPAPTPTHQEICFKLAKKFDSYLENSKCKMLMGINLRMFDEEGNKIGDVIPDISVFCDYKDIYNTFITEMPMIVVEIVSPSTIYTDNIEKAHQYKSAGVKEYWIISAKNKTVTVWDFINNEQYLYKDNEIICSTIFSEFKLQLKELLPNINYEK